MTDRQKVLSAVRGGARTSVDVEAIVNLPLHTCGTVLSILHRIGLLEIKGKRRYYGSASVYTEYAPVSRPVAELKKHGCVEKVVLQSQRYESTSNQSPV
jgi:hypothetical protein